MAQNFNNDWNPYAPPEQRGFGISAQENDAGHVLASAGARLGAFLLDAVINVAVAIPGILIAVLGHESKRRLSTMSVVGFVLGGVAILAVTIYQWYLISTAGQTIGKRLLQIRIVKVDGAPVDFVSGVVSRSWVPGFIGAVPYVGPLISLVGILMIFGEARRCLHDRIAGTKVVVAA